MFLKKRKYTAQYTRSHWLEILQSFYSEKKKHMHTWFNQIDTL